MSTSHSNARASDLSKARSDSGMRFLLLNIFTGSSIIFGDLDTPAKQFMISFMIVVNTINFYLIQMGIVGSMRALANDQSVAEAATAHGKLWLKSGNANTGKIVLKLVSVGYPLVQLAAIYM